eukprot:CAMPEP_0185031042 /NCGR_PEP_ID=MMETSP1103-20130426/18281_1 /TAXON_ID=36769 /ORGANISM="Paraphysomonas bandaiensis, Strain Caron Lab Isolate" /LENGTH=48 /DNA_ID= /DNA_START= /DNA_END= /DNA_ORIENTATION=
MTDLELLLHVSVCLMPVSTVHITPINTRCTALATLSRGVAEYQEKQVM